MKRRSKAGGKPVKARRGKTATLKHRNGPKVRRRSSSAAGLNKKVALLARERDELLEQQTATAEILQVINRSPGDLTPVFDAMLQKAMRLCEAAFGQLAAYDGERFRISATRGVPAAFAEYRRNNPPNYGPGTTPSRILEGERVICTDDLKAEPAYQLGEPNRRALVDLGGARSALIVALRKDDAVLGCIQIYRQEVRPFSDKQIELMQNFATQAVIAIENTRLLGELRQSEERYMLVSEAVLEGIYEWDIETNSLWASPRIVELFGFPGRELSAADFNKLVHPEDFPHYRAALRECFKGITARLDCEYRVRHSDGKYRWLEDRGVPVRNAAGRAVRLVGAQSDVTERKQGEQALREALEQQTATSEVLQAISSSPGELGPVFHTILSSATRLCEAKFATLYLHQAGEIRLVAAHDVPPAFADVRKRGLRPAPDGALGGVIRTKRTLQVADLAALRPYAERDLRMRDAVELAGIRTVIAVPLLKDDELIGIIEIYRQEVRPFTDKQIELVENFAAQAVIAIENSRLLNELRQRTDDLTESLEQQTATSEVLGVISRSKFELQPILQSVVDTAARLCRAEGGVIFRREDGIYRFAAGYSLDPAYLEIERKTPIVPGQGTVVGRAAMTGQVARIDDVWTDPLYEKKQEAKIGKGRSMIGVPLMREGEPIGVIGLARSRVDPFTEREIDLVTTFADQAVIAIENVRLFEAEQQRTQELARSIEDLRTAQDRLVQTEKLASLGQLTAGIAHEIKNPLNFVNNFSSVSVELIDELRDALSGAHLDSKLRAEIAGIADMLQGNLDKVVQHGKRADAIVKNMLLHSRQGSGEHRPVDINALVEESLNLAYHGARAEKQGFNITLERSFDPAAGEVDLFPQEITRVLLNLISNGFYAATKRKAEANEGDYEPTLAAVTKNLGDRVEIRIRDNGTGIPARGEGEDVQPVLYDEARR